VLATIAAQRSAPAARPEARDDATVPLAAPRGGLRDLLDGRRSADADDAGGHLDLDDLAALLDAIAGRSPDGRPALASAGALRPLVVEVLVRDPVGPVGPGLWWLEPDGAALRRLAVAAPEPAQLLVPDPLGDALLAARLPVIFLSADVARPARK